MKKGNKVSIVIFKIPQKPLTIWSRSPSPLLTIIVAPPRVIVLVARAWIAEHRVGPAMWCTQLEVVEVVLILAPLGFGETPVG